LAVVAIAVGAVWLLWSSGSQSGERVLQTRMYYTVDEGNTWFVEDAEHIPPFDYNGKTALRVRLFQGKDGKPFAGYLERYTAEAAKRLAAAKRGDAAAAGIQPGRPMLSLVEELAISGTEIKKPGPNNPWVRRADLDAARSVLDVRNADGQPAEAVMP
jgi:hypothetical protein